MFPFQIWPLVSKRGVNKSTSLSQGYHENVLRCVSTYGLASCDSVGTGEVSMAQVHRKTEISAGKLALPRMK